MSADLRIAVIGGGAIGATHAETVEVTDGFRLEAIVDPFDGGRRLAERHGVRHVLDHGALLAPGAVDAAVIATPNEMHVPMALDLIAAGIPVLVEKPVATTLAEARSLVSAVESSGVAALVGHHRRHHPVMRRAKAIIDAGELGRVVAANVTYFLSKPDDYFDVAWRGEKGTGGTFLINLIHEVDTLRHLVGEITRVSAMSSSATRGREVEDTGALSFAFDSGALAGLVISDTVAGPWSWDLTAGDSERFPVHAVESHRIGGVEASLTVPTLEVWRHDGERSWTSVMHREPQAWEYSSPYAAQLTHFGDVIAGRAQPLVSVREGAANIAVMEAIVEAAATGGTVDVEPVG